MASLKVDDVEWYRAYLETPLTWPHASSPEAQAKIPGCSLKSRERMPRGEPMGGFPKHYGKLVVFDAQADKVIVRGLGDEISPKFVWHGTVAEFTAFWECD